MADEKYLYILHVSIITERDVVVDLNTLLIFHMLDVKAFLWNETKKHYVNLKLFGNNITMKMEHRTKFQKKLNCKSFFFSQIAICCCWWFVPPKKHLSFVFHIFITIYYICIWLSTHSWRQHHVCKTFQNKKTVFENIQEWTLLML